MKDKWWKKNCRKSRKRKRGRESEKIMREEWNKQKQKCLKSSMEKKRIWLESREKDRKRWSRRKMRKPWKDMIRKKMLRESWKFSNMKRRSLWKKFKKNVKGRPNKAREVSSDWAEATDEKIDLKPKKRNAWEDVKNETGQTWS